MRGLAQQRLSARLPLFPPVVHQFIGQAQEGGRAVPRERALLQEACGPRQERLFCPRGLVGQRPILQADATADGGEEHASVKLDRPLPEALPIDHARAVTQVENVAGV